MLSKMRDTIAETLRQFFNQALAWLPIVNAEERSLASWAIRIKSYADLPTKYQDFFKPYATGERPFPYVLRTPSYEGYLHRASEKLVYVMGEEVYILEASGDDYKTICYPFADIAYIETRTVLLDSSIKLSGVTRQGERVAISFRFNSVTDHLFIPILNSIRLAGADPQSTVQSSELEKFDHWARVNYKFMNYARRSLLAGETVFQAILQPKISVKVMQVLGKAYYRTLSPPHATILTDWELIVIREEQRQRGDEYGGLWDFISLDKIAALALEGRVDGLLKLTISLPDEESLAYLFEAALKPELEQFLEKFREVKGG